MQDPELTRQPAQPVEGPRAREIGEDTGPVGPVAPVEPLDVDGTRTVAVGAALFLAAFLFLLPFYDHLDDAGKAWWVWTCLAGFGLGVVGWAYCRHRKHRRQAGAA